MIDLRYPDFIFTKLRNRNREKVKTPCIYAWIRDEIVLYLGMSMKGTERPFSSHHIIDTIEKFQKEKDVIFIWKLDGGITKKEVLFLEQQLLEVIKPKYNRTANGVLTKVKDINYKLFIRYKLRLKDCNFRLFSNGNEQYYNVVDCDYCNRGCFELDCGKFCSFVCFKLYNLRGKKE